VVAECVESPGRSAARGSRIGEYRSASDPAELIAHALLAGYVLPDVEDKGLKAAELCRARLSSLRAVGPRTAEPDDGELARLLADAETVVLLNSAGALDRVRAAAARRVRAAFAAVPGSFPTDLVLQVARAAAAAAGIRRMAQALGAPAHVNAVDRHAAAIRASRLTGRAPDPSHALAGREAAAAAIAAAMARGAGRRLDGRLHLLRETQQVIADQLREGRVHAGPARVPEAAEIRERVEQRLSRAAHERRDRAARLAARLIPELRAPGPPALIRRPPDRECLDWLHSILNDGLYSPGDDAHTLHWLGSDPYGLRMPPSPPDFLAGFDFAEVRPEHVAPLLRRLSLTRAEMPDEAEFTATALESDRGRLSVAERTEQQRRWGRAADSGAPLLAPVTRIPRVVHSIWLGGPPPLDGDFIDNVGYTARRYAGEIDYVLWTDVPRTAFSGETEDAAPARGLLAWARENGVLLVSVSEVFHRDAPMVCQAQFAAETAKQRPHGYAAASDILRLEVIGRFGGFYIDGDLKLSERYERTPDGEPFESVPQLIDRVAASELGFTMDPIPKWDDAVNNDLVIAPAAHPAVRLWSEDTRVNYLISQTAVVGGLENMSRRLSGMDLHAMRYLAPYRTGRVHHKVLLRLGLTGKDLPATQPPILYWSTCSWIPMNAPVSQDEADGAKAPAADDASEVSGTGVRRSAAGGEPDGAESADDAEVIRVLKYCHTALDWQLRAREGNLYLSSIDPVMRSLPDPDAGWTALLIAFSFARALGHAAAGTDPSAPAVSSVTYRRRSDDGVAFQHADLPPEALALIAPHDAPTGWLGSSLSKNGAPVWLLDECVQPALLRDARDPMGHPFSTAVPFAEVVLDLLGRPLSLSFGPYWQVRSSDHSPEADLADAFGFTTLPEGSFGLNMAGTPDWSWADEPALRPDTIAPLLLAAGAAGRAILMSVPFGTAGEARDFSARLADLLERPVRVIEGLPRPSVRPGGPLVMPSTRLRYREWSASFDVRVRGGARRKTSATAGPA
jgi:hypothetical protein